MPKLEIQQSHSLPLDEVKLRLQKLQDELAAKYGVSAGWVSDREAEVKRTGVTGKITCDESQVRIVLDLSFALTPLKSKIENRIKEKLAAALV